MLYREIIAVCSQIHTKHINTMSGQNVELLNVKLAVRRESLKLWKFNNAVFMQRSMMNANYQGRNLYSELCVQSFQRCTPLSNFHAPWRYSLIRFTTETALWTSLRRFFHSRRTKHATTFRSFKHDLSQSREMEPLRWASNINSNTT